MPDFSINSALICDDFRVEDNGKGMVIGIYGQRIGFVRKPDSFTFCLCLIGRAEKAFGLEVKAEFVPEEGGQAAEFQLGAEIERKDPGSDQRFSLFIPVKSITLPVNRDGRILVKTRAKGSKRWNLVSETIVEISQHHPNGQPPPS